MKCSVRHDPLKCAFRYVCGIIDIFFGSWLIVHHKTAKLFSVIIGAVINIILNFSLKKYGATAPAGYVVDGATLAISVETIVTAASSFIRQPINGL